MKLIDMNDFFLVHSGDPWVHAQPPCSRPMIQFLERNEGLVTWVQPKGGKIDDQIPVIRIQGQYFTMSLRMMKAVWRSVRLRKGFVNVEKALFGGLKLRIPTLLYVEKMRTQTRFNLMRMETAQQRLPTQDNGLDLEETAAAGGERGVKQVHNASSKVNLVVRKMLLPLLDTPMHPHVVFDAEENQEELDLLERMDRSRPEMLEDPKTFVQHLQNLLSRYHAYANGYSQVTTHNTDPLGGGNDLPSHVECPLWDKNTE